MAQEVFLTENVNSVGLHSLILSNHVILKKPSIVSYASIRRLSQEDLEFKASWATQQSHF